MRSFARATALAVVVTALASAVGAAGLAVAGRQSDAIALLSAAFVMLITLVVLGFVVLWRGVRRSDKTHRLLRQRSLQLLAASRQHASDHERVAGLVQAKVSSLPAELAREMDIRHKEALTALSIIETQIQDLRRSTEGFRQEIESAIGVSNLAALVQELGARLNTVRELVEALHRDLVRDVKDAISKHGKTVEDTIRLTSGLPLSAPLPSLGGWAIAPDLAIELVRLIIREQPRTILELGSGSSTVVMAYAIRINGTGHLWTVDHDPQFLQRTVEELEVHGLADLVTPILAPLVPMSLGDETWHWYQLDPSVLPSQVDLLLVDGPPAGRSRNRFPAVPMLRSLLSNDAIVVVDDTKRDDDLANVRRWSELFPEFTVSLVDLERGAAIMRLRGGTHGG